MSRRKVADPNEVALFRYRVIAPLLSEARGRVSAKAEALAQREWQIPGSDRTRVAGSTIEGWLRAYARGGFEALLPKKRADRHVQRRLSPEAVEALAGLKRELPHLSVRRLIVEAYGRGLVERSVRLPRSTVSRMLQRQGLMGPPPDDGSGGVDRRRFAYEWAGEMWQSDVLHGPRVRDHRGHARKVYLIAFLDDATRVVPHAAFAFSENTAAFLPVFRLALERRGLPARLFVENVPRHIFDVPANTPSHGAGYQATCCPCPVRGTIPLPPSRSLSRERPLTCSRHLNDLQVFHRGRVVTIFPKKHRL